MQDGWFAAAWGAKTLADGTLDVSMVVSVIAALGLGRLISLPFSGPLSDKHGRKLSGIIGVLCYVAYFFGMANSTSMAMGFVWHIREHKEEKMNCPTSPLDHFR